MAALTLGFDGLGAEFALTAAWHDNAASLGVTTIVGLRARSVRRGCSDAEYPTSSSPSACPATTGTPSAATTSRSTGWRRRGSSSGSGESRRRVRRGDRGSRAASGGRPHATPRCRAHCSPVGAPAAADRVRRSRSVEPGRGRGRPRRRISRTNSYQLTAPWLVTWCTPVRRSTARRRSAGARSAVKVGCPRWSSTNAIA